MELCKAILNYDMETFYKHLDGEHINSGFTYGEITGNKDFGNFKYTPLMFSVIMGNDVMFKKLLKKVKLNSNIVNFIINEKYYKGLKIITNKYNKYINYNSVSLEKLPLSIFGKIIENNMDSIDFIKLFKILIKDGHLDKIKLIFDKKIDVNMMSFSCLHLHSHCYDVDKDGRDDKDYRDIIKQNIEKVVNLKNLFSKKRCKFFARYKFLPKNIFAYDNVVIILILCCEFVYIPKNIVKNYLIPYMYA